MVLKDAKVSVNVTKTIVLSYIMHWLAVVKVITAHEPEGGVRCSERDLKLKSILGLLH